MARRARDGTAPSHGEAREAWHGKAGRRSNARLCEIGAGRGVESWSAAGIELSLCEYLSTDPKKESGKKASSAQWSKYKNLKLVVPKRCLSSMLSFSVCLLVWVQHGYQAHPCTMA